MDKHLYIYVLYKKRNLKVDFLFWKYQMNYQMKSDLASVFLSVIILINQKNIIFINDFLNLMKNNKIIKTDKNGTWYK